MLISVPDMQNNMDFGGIMPKLDPEKLPANAAQTAQDVNLLGDTLDTVHDSTVVEAGITDSNQRSIYLYKKNWNTLVCGTPGSFATLNAVNNGGMKVTIGENEYDVIPVDLTGAADEAGIASLLQTAIRTETSGYEEVEYDTDHYVVKAQDVVGYLSAVDDTAVAAGTGSALGDMVAYGGLSAAFNGVYYEAYGSCAGKSTIGTSAYIGKDWGAGNTKLLSKVNVYSSTTGYDATANSNVTLTVEGSATGAWGGEEVQLGTSGTFADAAANTVKEITCSGTTEYRYHRVKMTLSATGHACAISEVDFFELGTPIYNATYLNGISPNATKGEDPDGTWLTWDELKISVVRNPLPTDIYSRIYWTGEDDGKLNVKGLFGDREVGITAPASAPTIALADQYTEAFACRFQIVYAGPTTLNVNATINSIEKTDVGYTVIFDLEETVVTSASTPTTEWQFQVAGTGGGWLTRSDIGTEYPQTDSGATYSNLKITQVQASNTAAVAGTTYTWNERQATLTIDMQYLLQTNETIYYLMTYVNDLGEESPPSAVSATVTRFAEERATVTMPVSTESNVSNKRLYRSANSSDSTSGFFYLTEVTNATTTYIDWLRSEDLVEALSIRENPPDNLQGIVVMPGSFFMAFKGKTIYVSEQDFVFSWPSSYEINVQDEIVGLSVAGNECTVVTKSHTYQVTGDSPGTLRVSKLPINQSCVSFRGITQVGHRTLYPSPDGYVAVYGGQAELITEAFIQPGSWSNYNPDTIQAAVLDNKLFACSSSHFLVFDFDEGLKALTTASTLVQALYSDREDDTLYFIGVNDDDIQSWNTASGVETIIWKSKEFNSIKPWRPSVVRVEAESYDSCVLRLYAEGVLQGSITLTSSRAKKIPMYRPERLWSFQIESTAEVQRVQVASSMAEVEL